MSGDAQPARKKHRHDLGQEDHGPVYAAGTTKGIQIVLGMWIALAFGLVIYAMVDASAGLGRADQATPSAAAPADPAR